MRVFQTFPHSENTNNPYLAQLRTGLHDAGAQTITFTWTAALTGSYDAIHLHWPEALFAASTGPRRLRRELLFALWVLRLRLTPARRRPAIVRTVHNVGLPGGLPRRKLWLLARLDQLTTLRVRLNPFTEVPADAPVVTIAHGDYRAWLAGLPRSTSISGRIAYVGQVRRYKNVESLVRAFVDAASRLAGLSLQIGGRPTSSEIETVVRDAAAGREDVLFELRHLEDAELVRIVTEAELVVLPYRFMHNSGSVFYALSLDRPVLVPDNEVNRALADEIGPGWMQMFTGELTGEALAEAVTRLRAEPPSAPPRLDARGWPEIGAAHVRAFEQAVTP